MSPSITALSHPSPHQCTTDDNFISSRPTQLKYCSRFKFFYIFLSLYDLMFEYVDFIFSVLVQAILLNCMGNSIILGWQLLTNDWWQILKHNYQPQRLSIKLVEVLFGMFNQRLQPVIDWDYPTSTRYKKCYATTERANTVYSLQWMAMVQFVRY